MYRSLLLALSLALCACASQPSEPGSGEPESSEPGSSPSQPRDGGPQGVAKVKAPAENAPSKPSAYPVDIRGAACVVTCEAMREADEAQAFTTAFKESVDGILDLRSDPDSALKITIKLRLSNDTISPGDPGHGNRAVSGKIRGTGSATLIRADGGEVRVSLVLAQSHTSRGRYEMREHLIDELGRGVGRKLLAKLAKR
jgi:hypothetical protein